MEIQIICVDDTPCWYGFICLRFPIFPWSFGSLTRAAIVQVQELTERLSEEEKTNTAQEKANTHTKKESGKLSAWEFGV